MPEEALSRARSFIAGSIRGRRADLPLREPVDSFRRNAVRIFYDLRLPLTAILANAEFLTKPRLTESERGEFYDEIRSAIDFMSEMISSLLEGSTESESVWPMERDVVQTVERAIHMTRVRYEFRDIAITHRHEGMAIGWFDSNRIERAIANLILNACEAVSPQSGQVLVTTKGVADPSCRSMCGITAPGFQLRFGVPSFNLLLVMASRMEAALGSPSPRRLLNATVVRSIWSDALKQELFLQLVFRFVIREGAFRRFILCERQKIQPQVRSERRRE